MTRKHLDQMVCKACDCDKSEFWFHASCHPEAPTWVRYHKDGFVTVTCSVCKKEICKIEVAP